MNHATRNALQSIPVCRGFLTKAVNLRCLAGIVRQIIGSVFTFWKTTPSKKPCKNLRIVPIQKIHFSSVLSTFEKCIL